MSESSNQDLLRQKVIEASFADTWEKAKLEWSLVTIYDQLGGSCECCHRITQHCIIWNDQTNRELVVGNVCINHFKVKKLFVPVTARACLKRIRKSIHSARANKHLLEVAYRLDIISEEEQGMYSKYTTGKGSRNRFRTNHRDYDGMAVEVVEKVNTFIVLGFRGNRPKCNCGKFAKPRQNEPTKDYSYWCRLCDWNLSVSPAELMQILG
jgi:hypothetical protein